MPSPKSLLILYRWPSFYPVLNLKWSTLLRCAVDPDELCLFSELDEDDPEDDELEELDEEE
mgnify:CR=1 FL=1